MSAVVDAWAQNLMDDSGDLQSDIWPPLPTYPPPPAPPLPQSPPPPSPPSTNGGVNESSLPEILPSESLSGEEYGSARNNEVSINLFF